jgi:methylmalonyl-CoA mutase N-terminal domain/subunit
LLLKQNGCRKSICKQIIEEKIEEFKVTYYSSIKAKEAIINGVNLFPKKTKASFRCQQFIWQFKTGN